tara:strand:- start:122 stop:2245 length:2124 start_codon:yes stop_codon:yes gene_type:complete
MGGMDIGLALAKAMAEEEQSESGIGSVVGEAVAGATGGDAEGDGTDGLTIHQRKNLGLPPVAPETTEEAEEPVQAKRYRTDESQSSDRPGDQWMLWFLNGLDEEELRSLFEEYEMGSRLESGSEYFDGLVDEAIDSGNERYKDLGAGRFIDLFVAAYGGSEGDLSSFDAFGGDFNWVDYIRSWNEQFLDVDVDFEALSRGETIDLGDVDLKVARWEGGEAVQKVKPDVQISSLGEWFALYEEISEDYGIDTTFAPRWLTFYDGLEDQTGEEIRDEWQAVKTDLQLLTSPRAEDVGGGLILSGYGAELESLDPGNIKKSRNIILTAQSQLGSIQSRDVPVDPLVEFGPSNVLDPGQRDAERLAPTVANNPEEYEELKGYLHDMYGGSSFFFEMEEPRLLVGLNQFDKPVRANSEDAVRNVFILDYFIGNYVTQDGSTAKRVTNDEALLEAIQVTDWYQTSNGSMREWEAKYGSSPLDYFIHDMSKPNQLDVVGPIVDDLRDIASQAGATIEDWRLIRLAAEIDYLGYETDDVRIRQEVLEAAVAAEIPWSINNADFSEIKNLKDSVTATARKYYLPLTDSKRDELAEQLFTGELTEGQVLARFKTQASARFDSPQIQAALAAGLTMEDYFDPYKAEMEAVLGRPVDLFEEFPNIIEMIPSDGALARPMSFAEAREFTRGLPEWAQTDTGQDSGRDIAFEMGKLFGETA